ncbi:MAG: metalloregulator ArsR/SmtB family transcription factor [Caulobacter sp.]|nr:metalloregulator ArsR/SmtB family transcription factor [Caulobacter sp.]
MTMLDQSVQELAENARTAADLLRVLANEHRLQVLCALRQGEQSVGQLAGHVGLSQSALSQHLARLRADRVVETRRKGQTIFYRIADDEVMTVLDAVASVMALRRQRAGR